VRSGRVYDTSTQPCSHPAHRVGVAIPGDPHPRRGNRAVTAHKRTHELYLGLRFPEQQFLPTAVNLMALSSSESVCPQDACLASQGLRLKGEPAFPGHSQPFSSCREETGRKLVSSVLGIDFVGEKGRAKQSIPRAAEVVAGDVCWAQPKQRLPSQHRALDR